jgi:hypothetical protein
MVVSLYVMGIAGNFWGMEDFFVIVLVFPVNKLILACFLSLPQMELGDKRN